MKPLSSDEQAALVNEFIALGIELHKIKDRRAKIAEQLPAGRSLGTQLDVYKAIDRYVRAYSAKLLEEYVPEATLRMCRVTRRKKGGVKVDPKKKESNAA